jgi:hypothetical protein
MAATKAELHAVMASLTYKDRVAVTSDALGSSIQKIFQGNRHSQDPTKQHNELQAFLSNPYEAVAAIGMRSCIIVCAETIFISTAIVYYLTSFKRNCTLTALLHS